jgi:hypothetical protein
MFFSGKEITDTSRMVTILYYMIENEKLLLNASHRHQNERQWICQQQQSLFFINRKCLSTN